MILEGVVTTLGPDGRLNVAPMGPHVPDTYPGPDFSSFDLLPFASSRTFANLTSHPEGVLHVTDDVLLLARAAIDAVDPDPETGPAEAVRGRILAGACRAYEFRIAGRADDSLRPRLTAVVLRAHDLRPFFGFNRARFAVVEAAILATRVHLLARGEIEADLARLRRLVDKTGGPRECEAFDLLEAHVRKAPDAAAPPADSA